uniref:Diphthine--ammonia ligase n=1 Tax=Nymphaea colorata TaxID=210225 RepID=A0A5K1HG99_9MAGN|nr:unnamed protein product [Nymphaea colorata]
MKVLALISGGKDSIYNLCRCIDEGHEVVALGNLYNCGKFGLIVEEGHEGYETDSYMYQTVGTNATLSIAEALERPIYRRPIIGKPKKMTLEYDAAEEGDEVEDLDLLVVDVLVPLA